MIIRLKNSHNYYYQIQDASGMTLLYGQNVDFHRERVPWNPQFFMSVLPKLHKFYFSAILPKLALPRMHTGGIHEWLSKPDRNKMQNAGKGMDDGMNSCCFVQCLSLCHASAHK